MRRRMAPRPAPRLTAASLHKPPPAAILPSVPQAARHPKPTRYARWDRIDQAWVGVIPGVNIHWWPNLRWRYDVRTAPFDAATDSDADPAPLAAEYAARVEAFRNRVENAGVAPVPDSRRLRILQILLPVALAACILLGYLSAVLSGPVRLVPAFLTLFTIFSTAVLTVRLLLLHHPLSRLIDAIDHRRCPDCGYDLTGAPPAIDPTRLAGADVGPRLCPECGSPWPLLPPPATCSIDTLPPSLRRPIPARPQASQTHPAPQPPVPPTTA